MSKVRDPQGNELKLVLLQVLSSDMRGPILLQARRDDERVGLADTTEEQRQFHMVWVPLDSTIGDVTMTQLVTDFEELKTLHQHREAMRAQLTRDLDNIRHEMEGIQADNRAITDELRKLQRERDPERQTLLAKEASDKATAALTSEIANLKIERQTRDNEIRELKESKRRLKEANERLKKDLERR